MVECVSPAALRIFAQELHSLSSACSLCDVPPRYRFHTPEEFWFRVSRGLPTACWPWTANISPSGYAEARYQDGPRTRAHRLAWELTNGPIPKGLVIDHLCRVRHCCNPTHMEVVTTAENTLRGMGRSAQQARWTHCPRGHEFTPENIYWTPKTHKRQCRECVKRRSRESWAKRKKI